MYKWATLLSKGPQTAFVTCKYLAFKGAQRNCNALLSKGTINSLISNASCFSLGDSSLRYNPVATGAFLGLAPPNKAPCPLKLKYETLYLSGMFVKIECQSPYKNVKSPAQKQSPPVDDFLATVLLQMFSNVIEFQWSFSI